MIKKLIPLALALCATSQAAELLVETESFDKHGGWQLDTQFIREMGSPYLLAHGLGQPVDDASTSVTFPESGTWHVYLRTKNWLLDGALGGDANPRIRIAQSFDDSTRIDHQADLGQSIDGG